MVIDAAGLDCGADGDVALVGVLLRRATELQASDPLAALDVLVAALRLSGPADRAAVKLEVAMAHWSAAQFLLGEEILLSVLEDEAAPPHVRQDAAVFLVQRQLAQVRLGAAAESIHALLRLPVQIDAGEREVLRLFIASATTPPNMHLLQELTRLIQVPPRAPSFLPSHALLFLTSQVIYSFGAVTAGIDLLRRAVELTSGEDALRLKPILAALLATEEPAQAKVILGELSDCADLTVVSLVTVTTTFVSLVQGDWERVDRARVHLRKAAPLDGVLAGFQAFVLSVLARVRGDPTVANEVQAIAADMVDPDDWISRMNVDVARANTAIARGRQRLAAEALVDCISSVERTGAVGLTVKFAGHVGTLLDCGRRDAAERLGALVDAAADRHPSPVLLMYRAWKDALLTGDPELHVSAVRAEAACCLRIERAEINERAATAVSLAGRTQQAVHLLRTAAAAHAAAGAWESVARVRAQLRVRGVRLHAAHQVGALLSHTETAIVALTVEGLSNASIAARLGISVGTVGTHLSRIYRKFGMSSRAELIARTIV